MSIILNIPIKINCFTDAIFPYSTRISGEAIETVSHAFFSNKLKGRAYITLPVIYCEM